MRALAGALMLIAAAYGHNLELPIYDQAFLHVFGLILLCVGILAG